MDAYKKQLEMQDKSFNHHKSLESKNKDKINFFLFALFFKMNYINNSIIFQNKFFLLNYYSSIFLNYLV